MAMTAHGHFRAKWNRLAGQARPLYARRRREGDIPDLIVDFDLHRAVRTGERHLRLECAGNLELLFGIPGPPVMGLRRDGCYDGEGHKDGYFLHLNTVAFPFRRRTIHAAT